MQKSLFVGVPIHDGKIHHACVSGLLSVYSEFSGRCAIETVIGSFLPRSRDILTAKFLDSGATHMLCLDSDIGFVAEDVNKLLESNKDFISGVYCKKTDTADVPARLSGKVDNGLLSADYVPAGFIVLSRQCVERMVGAYRSMQYFHSGGSAWALWASTFDTGKEYSGEDVAFCNRWRAIGGDIFIDPSVIVRHYGDYCYLPKLDSNNLLKFDTGRK